MTRIMIAVLALAIAVAAPTFAQNTTGSTNQASPTMSQQPDQNSSQPMQQPAPGQAGGSNASSTDSQSSPTLMGTISADGKTLTTNNATFRISNPNSVKPYANQPVTVGYEMDSNDSIHISKVMLTQPPK